MQKQIAYNQHKFPQNQFGPNLFKEKSGKFTKRNNTEKLCEGVKWEKNSEEIENSVGLKANLELTTI